MFRLVVVGIFLLFQVETVKIHITGDLICPKMFFNYSMAIKEFDWHFGNDRLYTSGYYSSFYPHHYSADTEVNDVDELENDKYEIMVSFWHTCTDDGKWLYYESRVGYVKQEGEYWLQHNVNLTNAQGHLTWRDWEDWVTSNGFVNRNNQWYQLLVYQ